MHTSKRFVAALLATVAVLVGAGSGLADDGGKHTAPPGTALRDAIAARLGVTPAQLQAAVTGAMIARIDAAVASGKLSAARGAKLKQAIADGKLGKLRLGLHKRAKAFVKRAHAFGAFTRYLGVTMPELRAELKAGKSLAQIAQAHGKSAGGLVNVALETISDRLDRAVAKGRISEARKQELLAAAKQRLEKLVTKTFTATSS